MQGRQEYKERAGFQGRTFHKERRWSKQAIDCYSRGCRCAGCDLSHFEFHSIKRCELKYTVIELVRQLGRPPEIKLLNNMEG